MRRGIQIVYRALWIGFLLSGLSGSGLATGPAGETSAESALCPEVEFVVERIQARYEGIRDLAADFEQVSRAVVLAGSLPLAATVQRGEVVFAKPGRMRWRYLEPEPSLVVSNGTMLWIYDVDARQVTQVSVGRGHLTGAALQFLLGEGKLDETFGVTLVGCQGDVVEMNLFPREPAGYERLAIRVDSSTGLVTATDTFDLFGNQTSLIFSKIVQNQSPDPTIFEFATPEGVELIEFGSIR